MNIFLYIPAHYVHFPDLINSIVPSLLKTYWDQNTKKKDFIKITRLPFNRLTLKGFKTDQLHITFSKAAIQIENYSYPPSNTYSSEEAPFNKRLFFHLPYHPRLSSRLCIRNEYENICE